MSGMSCSGKCAPMRQARRWSPWDRLAIPCWHSRAPMVQISTNARLFCSCTILAAVPAGQRKATRESELPETKSVAL